MTKGIKVWIAELDGVPVIALGSHSTETLGWVQLTNSHLALPDDLKSRGWTVEPYTLTKGHGDD